MKTPANEPRPLAPRSAARLSAVQALYQMDLAETDLNNVIGQFNMHHFGENAEDKSVAAADRDFFAAILRGVVRRQREIDPTAVALRECLENPAISDEDDGTRERIAETLKFIETMSTLADEMLRLKPETLMKTLGMTAKISNAVRKRG